MAQPQWRIDRMFSPDFRIAQIDDGEVTFTAAESRLLYFLSSHPQQMLSRQQIMDAIYEDGAAKSDRSIDFLISRLRRKLGDVPRAPRFIETCYGGGYVWIGPRKQTEPKLEPDATGALVIVGPIWGLGLMGTDRAAGLAFAKALTRCLTAEIGEDVVLFEAGPSAAHIPKTRFHVELTFFRETSGCECVVAAREVGSEQVLSLRRVPVVREATPFAANTRTAEMLTPALLAERWKLEVDRGTATEPLPVAMQNASLQDNDGHKSWAENDRILRQLHSERPQDPDLALILANHLHSGVVSNGAKTFLTGTDASNAIDAEIEALVQQALAWCQTRPEKAMIAAKLLYYVNRSYKPLALELARKAHKQSTAIAASLALYGQLLAFSGDIDAALDLLRQAEDLTTPGSRFRHYVQVLLCQALLAGGNTAELEPVRAEIYRYHPLVRTIYEFHFGDADRPTLKARGMILASSKVKAQALLSWSHRIYGGLFEDPQHRINALRGPVSMCVRRHGLLVVPDEVRTSAPALFD